MSDYTFIATTFKDMSWGNFVVINFLCETLTTWVSPFQWALVDGSVLSNNLLGMPHSLTSLNVEPQRALGKKAHNTSHAHPPQRHDRTLSHTQRQIEPHSMRSENKSQTQIQLPKIAHNEHLKTNVRCQKHSLRAEESLLNICYL